MARSISPCCWSARPSSSRSGISSRCCAAGSSSRPWRGSSAPSCGLQMARDGMPPLPQPAGSSGMMYVRSPEAARRIALGYDALAADLYWIRAIQHYGGTKLSTASGQDVRSAVPAPGSDDLARPAIRRCVPVWRNLPVGAAPERPRTTRSCDRAAAQGTGRAARAMAVRAGHRLRALLVAATTTSRPPSGSVARRLFPAHPTG